MRRMAFIVGISLFLFSSVVHAAGPSFNNSSFDMNKIKLNGEEIYEYSPPSFILNSEFARIKKFFDKLAETLGSILVWDEANKTIEVIKPNVQMITATMVGKDEKTNNLIVAGPFGKVKKGDKLERFFVYTEITNLPEEEVELKLVVETPGNDNPEEFVVTPGVVKNNISNPWINFEVANPNFSQAGVYKVKLQMKYSKIGNSFITIAQKEIYSN